MKILLCLAVLAPLSSALAQAPDAATLYSQNCAACHMLDQALVGPSLVEIRTLYTDQAEDFVKWSIAPQKKRPTAIEMPSMAHLGEPALLAIHAHMLKLAEGVVEKPAPKGDPFATSPTQTTRPLVLRIFMPDAGPASIAVALDDRVSLCWDAGPCRLRYAWTGGFVDGFPYWRGNGHGLATVLGNIRYTEPSPLIDTIQPRFKGYNLDANGHPTFRYRIGGLDVRESYLPLTGDKIGFTRKISFAFPGTAPLTLTFPDTPEKTGISADKGTWSGTTLTLPEGTAEFTLTHLFP